MYVVDVKVSQSSIDGRGVFAESDIPKGKIVWLFQQDHDQRLTDTEFQRLPANDKEHLSHTAYFSPWSSLWVFPPKGDPAEYTNHSDAHNLSILFDENVSPEPYFVANRNIKAGEELTNNYHEFDEITRNTKPSWARPSAADEAAQVVYNYMKMDMDVSESDIIVGLGSSDDRVAERASQLQLDGIAPVLIFSGGFGKITKDLYHKPEAEHFQDIALSMGVNPESIYIEPNSTNTGENIQGVYALVKKHGLASEKIILVTKTYMERRVYATFMKQWPIKTSVPIVTSPQLGYWDMFNDEASKTDFINIMTGDLQRIQQYPALGYQIPQDIPDEVLSAYNKLVELGYTRWVQS